MLQTLLLILLPWLLRHHVRANQDIDYGALCPYSNLCQKNAQLTRQVDEEMWPCCSPCSCADNCYMFKRCCPDKTWTNNTEDMSTAIEASCPSQQDLYNRYFGTNRIYNTNNYHVISTCPEQLSHKSLREAVHRCEHGNGTLHDAHFVSDEQNETLYFNKYCALCNGVQNIVPWRLKATCVGDKVLDVRSIKERDIYTLSNCEISSVPPTEDVGFKFLCKSDTIDRCNLTKKWTFYDPVLEQKCLNYDILFKDYTGGYDQEYANIYCYLCNMPDGVTVNHLCNTPFYDRGRFFFYPFSFLITAKPNKQEHFGIIETPCKIFEIWDEIMLKCRTLLCPPSFIPENGECLPLVENIDGMVFHIYHKFNITLETFKQLQIEDEKWLNMIKRISKIQKLKSYGCLLCSILITADPSGLIISETTVASTEKCSVKKLLGVLHRSMKALVEFHWEAENLNLEVKLINGEKLLEKVIGGIVAKANLMCERGSVFTLNLVHCPGFRYALNELESSSIRKSSKSNMLSKSTPVGNRTYMICYHEYLVVYNELTSDKIRLTSDFSILMLTLSLLNILYLI